MAGKGVPVTRKAAEPAQRRRLEADDLIQMLTLLDVHKVELPKVVADDLDRVAGALMTADNHDISSSSSSITSLADVHR